MSLGRWQRHAAAASLASLIAWMPGQAGAAVIATGCDTAGDTLFGTACSLAELAAGGSLRVADKTFSGFSLATFSGRGIDAQRVRVDPIDVSHAPGFTLVDTAGTLRAVVGDNSASDLGFDVSIADGPLHISGFRIALGVGEVTGDDSFASMFATLLTPDFSTVLGNSLLVCDTLTPVPCGGTTLSDAGLFDPLDALSVAAGFDIFAGASGVAQINSISFAFQQVPAPGSLALMGLGLAGLLCARRTLR